VAQCAEEEIPVISPLQLPCGSSVGEYEGIYIAVYPKRWGREIELNSEEAWIRLGGLLGRMHLVGAREDAPERLALHPEDVTYEQLDLLLDSGHITPAYEKPFDEITTKILELFHGEFDDVEFIRVHGDCHRANILERPEEGLMIIDFDDMLIAPPIQDLWLLLPDYAKNSQRELNLLLSGYEQFRDFDYQTCRLIEPLRAMRLIYFLSWCGMQENDNHFLTQYPDWGTDAFWRREIMDLEKQYSIIKSDIEFRKR
jgi:Ser/Thr protein kinase RdoA (MazF antagonist)